MLQRPRLGQATFWPAVGVLAALWLPAMAWAQPQLETVTTATEELHAASRSKADPDTVPRTPSPAVAAGSPGSVNPSEGASDPDAAGGKRKGYFLPVPIFITDPAVGKGGGFALAYLKPVPGNGLEGSDTTSDIYGIAYARTSNGSSIYGLGASLHFSQDRWRYVGFVGRPSINLEYYTQSLAVVPPAVIAYNVDGYATSQKVMRQLGHRNLYLGLAWTYLDMSLELVPASDRQFFKQHELAAHSSGLGVSLLYDTRDNSYTPSSGLLGLIEGKFYSEAIGSDNDYQVYNAHVYGYLPLHDKRLVVGGRLEVSAANGRIPFYMLPYVHLRGIPSARYQDTREMTVETEVRWNYAARWALIGFAGVGRTWGRHNSFGDADNHFSKGFGLRYKLIPKLGLYVGADYALGPEHQTLYIEVGSAWR